MAQLAADILIPYLILYRWPLETFWYELGNYLASEATRSIRTLALLDASLGKTKTANSVNNDNSNRETDSGNRFLTLN